MINRIKYRVRKFKLKVSLLIKSEVDNEKGLKEMSSIKRKFFILKKLMFKPRRFLNILSGKEFNISYIEIPLTTVCTLNCKGCSALMNYYEKSEHIGLEQNLRPIERVLKICDSIRHLRLLGGEPLCYPYLYEMLCFISKQDKIKRATIVTNGTLLINDSRIIEILKNDKFDVFISNYGENSRKKEELIDQLKENSIRYVLGDKDFLWRDYGNLESRNRSKKELEKQFLNCTIACNSILNGKLHHCPRSSHGTYLKKISLRDEDYIDLLDEEISEKNLRKKLYKFFYGFVPYVEACNHCNSGTYKLESIPAGQQCKKSADSNS